LAGIVVWSRTPSRRPARAAAGRDGVFMGDVLCGAVPANIVRQRHS
jgi:hypothetical protein